MQIPWDADVFIFAWSTLNVVFRAQKRMQESQRALPVRQELQEVHDAELTPAQKNYIRKFDEQLAKLNYLPDTTYRVTNFRNYGSNLSRHYVNAADRAFCKLTIVELSAKVGSVESVKTSSSVSFVTRFMGGTFLVTRNMSLKSLVDNPPYRTVQECRHTSDVAELKRRHDAWAAKMGQPLPVVAGPEAVFGAHHEENERYSKHQLERGIYRLTPDGQAYELTEKARWRGIRNFFNPFARRISIPVTLLTALIGAVFPLLAILQIGPAVARHLESTGSGNFAEIATRATIAAAYAVAGLLIGGLAERATFHGMMLTSYVPAHLVAGWSFGWLPYTTVMFVVAFAVTQAKRRRGLLFQTR
jgi:hypothetical protein